MRVTPSAFSIWVSMVSPTQGSSAHSRYGPMANPLRLMPVRMASSMHWANPSDRPAMRPYSTVLSTKSRMSEVQSSP